MIHEIPLRDLYGVVLNKFNFPPLLHELLSRIVAGSEKADDYEETLKKDAFFTKAICERASASMKTSIVKSLGHGVVLFGQQKVRNFVLGHSVERMFSDQADAKFESFEVSEKNIKYGMKAEEHSKKAGSEYAGLALASGFIYDVFAKWISKAEQPQEQEIFLEGIWKHGLKTAALAWSLATHERVFISHRKIIYASGLLHDIGKMGLAMYNNVIYSPVLEKMRREREANITDDGYEAVLEREAFDLTHMEVGSAIVFQTRVLADLEKEIDYHHDSVLLRTRDSDAFLGVAILNIADRLAWLYERKPAFEFNEVQEILKPHASYFPLKSPDVMDVFAKCRTQGLI